MRRSTITLTALMAAMMLSLWGCGSNRDSGGDQTVSPESAADPQALFVGSQACQTCHPSIYASFKETGHPYKVNKVVNGQIPTYPFSSINGALEQIGDAGSDSRIDLLDGKAPLADNGPQTDNNLGTPLSYRDVSYVIGGFGWKARWLDADGFIVTGTGVQYNLEDGSMVGYHNDETNKVFNCGNCHTTGWRHYDGDLNPNRQDNLPGMDGTFVEAGIQCEACHGPGAAHVGSQDPRDIVRVAEARTTSDFLAGDMGYGKAVACSECHTRDGEKDYPSFVSSYNQAFPNGSKEGGRIAASGGLIKHHEQFDEMLGVNPDTGSELGKHLAANITCVTCHDPHKSIKYQDQTGETALKVDCNSCHGVGEAFEIAMPADSFMADLDCTSCHMPKITKNAVKHAAVGAGPATGDIATHIFRIDLSKESQFTEDGKFAYPWITKDYACATCHNGVDSFDITGTDLSGYTFHQSAVGLADSEAFVNQYAGSATCGACHEQKYEDFRKTGHPYKVNKVVDGQVPVYPFSTINGALERIGDAGSDNRIDLLDGKAPLAGNGTETDNNLGTPLSYNDVSYVIGGFGWKARWLDADGFVVTGTAVQYNLEDDSMSAYHNDETNKVFNCGNCHTTGWKHYDENLNPNRQDDLPGMDGTFAEAGIQCESCHGAGLRHVFTTNFADIVKTATPRTTNDFLADDMAYGMPVACGECHTRDGEKDYPSYLSGANNAGYTGLQGGRIVSNGTIAKHHEQYDELLGLDINADGSLVLDELGDANLLGKHLNAGISCATCHDPHKSTKYGAEGAIKVDCITCHSDKNSFTVASHGGTDCITCHMPLLTKNAIWTGTNAAGKDLGDIKSHIFKIDLSKTNQLTDDNGFVYPWITPDYACGSCHSDPAQKVLNLGNGTIHSN